MFWNKNKIPSYTIETDEIDNQDSIDQDLFYYDQDESNEVYKVRENNDYPDLNSYDDEEISYDINNEEEKEENVEKEEIINRRLDFSNKIVNIILIVVAVLGFLITVDILCVTRLNAGPFFAIRTKVVNDGGSKIYHGLGYKVIKYRQTSGRNDLVLGGWSLEYSTTAIDVDMVDLAIDFNSSLEDKYLNKFIRVTGDVLKFDNNKVELIYLDDDGKYTTRLICSMSTDVSKVDLTEKDRVTLVGTLYDYENGKSKELKMKNCYIR